LKSVAETIFNNIAKESFHAILKPLGFRKKGNNFYSQKDDGLGHIVNLQRSTSSTKEDIRFTINTGIFLPEYWEVQYNYFSKPIPDFPTEPECVLRTRIGSLRNQHDTWYDITAGTDEVAMIDEMKRNLTDYILPHFNRISSKGMLIDFLDTPAVQASPLDRLIIFGEFGHKEKARREFETLIATTTRNPGFLNTLKMHGRKYGLL